jgi:hypothetical protein
MLTALAVATASAAEIPVRRDSLERRVRRTCGLEELDLCT